MRWLRFVCAWTGVSALTLVLMMLLIAVFSQLGASPVAMIVVEGVVVGVEAWCIVVMLGSDRFSANPDERPGPLRAVVYSFIANLASVAGGALLLSFP